MKDMPRSRAHRLFGWYVELAERHTGKLLLALFLVAAGALYMSLKLELHTDMAELLPDQHPAVLALRRIGGRQKSATNLVLIIHSPSAAANEKFAEAMRPELDKMIPDTFSEIQWRPDTEVPDYAAKYKWMYAEDKDLQNAEDFLDRIIAKRSSPLAVDLEGDPDEELKKLREKLNQKLPARQDSTYFEGAEKGESYLGIMLWRHLDGLATRGVNESLDFVRETVKRIGPEKYDPKMVVEFTGGIAQAIDEQNGIRDDLTIATVMCATLVLLVIYIYFRRFGLLLVIGAPAVMGLLLALTIASFTIHYLNINTAFLISIILGNGINSPIILLARYGEERRRGQEVATSLTNSMANAFLGTIAAMGAASIAYGCLLLTSFRGFNQFGLLGGAGMLLVWIFTFLLVPPLVIIGERWKPGVLTPRGNLWRRPFAFVGMQSEKRPMMTGLITLILIGAAAAPLYRYVKDPIEWNFENLRTDDTPSQRLWSRMELMGMGNLGAGYIGNNAVLLVDKPEQADEVAEAMRKQDAAKGKQHVLATVRTLSSMLPANQDEKLAMLARIRNKIDRHKDMMDKEELAEVNAWRPPDYLHKLTPDDLPRQVREAFTEVDGQRGRLVGFDADHTTYYDWNGHDLLRMAKALRVDALGQSWVAASAATIFAGMLETIINDGPRVTMVALCGVTLLILLAFGIRGAVPVLASLAVGIIWLLGCLGQLNIKINFMNFVALPITLGVGADYAANIWARLRAEGPERLTAVIGDTGSAVALCSITTMIGYSSLLMSHNRALRSFGLLADVGEVTCLLAALVALPAMLQIFRRRRGK